MQFFLMNVFNQTEIIPYLQASILPAISKSKEESLLIAEFHVETTCIFSCFEVHIIQNYLMRLSH